MRIQMENSDDTLTKICVCTCLFGNYEHLNEFPVELDSKVARFCFTDNPNLQSDTWEIKVVKPAFEMDSVRSQRLVKILLHEYLDPKFDISLYIDNSVLLKEKPEDLIEKYMQNADIAAPRHSHRLSVLDEFVLVAQEGLDDPARIFEQLNHYQMLEQDVLGAIPYWTAILMRRHNRPNVKEAMRDWSNHVLRYSRRDQLSFNVALLDKELTVQAIEMDDNSESQFHKWPVGTYRNNEKRNHSIAMSGASLRAQIRLEQMKCEEAKKIIKANNNEIQRLSAALKTAEIIMDKAGVRI